MATRSRHGKAGFTLIEMIMVMVLIGIVAGLLSNILVGPIRAYRDFKLRATVVDIAETALQRMSREIRLALPNSVRVSGNSVEFLLTKAGGRYRANAAAVGVSDPLDFSLPSDSFDLLALSPAGVNIATSGTGDQSECLNGNADCLVIYNTGQSGFNSYAGDNIATITAATAASITFDNTLPGGSPFPTTSPSQRFFVVDGPVSFVCDLGAGTIQRVANYAITEAQDANPAGTSRLLVDNVSACAFQYSAGTESRGGILTMLVEIRDTTYADGVDGYVQPRSRLMQQVHVSNAP